MIPLRPRIEQLLPAESYDLAIPCSWFEFFGILFTPHGGGEAYLEARRYADAAAEFQKILDHPGVVFTDAIRPVTELQLPRTWARFGDKKKASTAYRSFLDLWHDGDPNIPI